MVGLVATTKLAVFDGGPAGSNAEDTPLVVFGLVPTCTLLTVNVTVQVSIAGVAGILIPEKLMDAWPAVSTAAPLQPAFPPTVAVCPTSTDIFARASLKAAFVCATPVGLLSLRVIVACRPGVTTAGEIALLMVIRPTPKPAVLEGGPASGVWVVVAPPEVFK